MRQTRLMLMMAVSLGATGGSAGVAAAQAALRPVLEQLAAQGYGAFEVEREGRFLKVEAHRDGFERELRYDFTTGELVRDREQRSDDRATGGSNPVEFASAYDRALALGLTGIEIEQRGSRIKVEGVRDGVEREIYFSARTGELLSDRVDDEDDDDHGGRGRDDDDDDDDAEDDDAEDDDGDDDHGGGGNSGPGGEDDDDDADDDAGDDHGDDDHGDDDHGGDGNSGHGGGDDDDADGGDDDDDNDDNDDDEGDDDEGEDDDADDDDDD